MQRRSFTCRKSFRFVCALLGTELLPAMGKLGGLVGVFTFSFFMRWHGLLSAESSAAIVSALAWSRQFSRCRKRKAETWKKSDRSRRLQWTRGGPNPIQLIRWTQIYEPIQRSWHENCLRQNEQL